MKAVLVLQHVPYEGQGSIADYLQDHDIKFDVLRLWQPYAVPDVSTYSALIVMGGPMGVYEDFPSRDDELALIKAAIGRIRRSGSVLEASSSLMRSARASIPMKETASPRRRSASIPCT